MDGEPPSDMLCPITHELMITPVMDREGHNFEKQAITQWLSSHSECPVGREPLTADQLYLNRGLKQQIEDWKARRSRTDAQFSSFFSSPSSSIPSGGSRGGYSSTPANPRPRVLPPPPSQPSWAKDSAKTSPASSSAPGSRNTSLANPGLPWVKYGTSQEEYDRVMCMFMTFDTDGSGELDPTELKRLCKYMNYPSEDREIAEMFRQMDTNGSGTLDLDEFLEYMQTRRPRPEMMYGISNTQYQQFMMQFHSFDDNGDGELDRNELRRLCEAQRYGLTAAQVDSIFQAMDTDRSGRLSAHEFLTYMKDHPVSSLRSMPSSQPSAISRPPPPPPSSTYP
eukprot:RCo035834